MSGPFQRVDTVFLPVRDLDRAVAWYTRLGLGLRWRQGNYAALDLAETPVTLYQPEGEYRPVTGHEPFNFYAPDVDAAHALLGGLAARVGEVQRSEGFAYFSFEDPDGNRLAVCSYA
jgi:catechol 2,3-dioxygenase-like lactoylglutathione lyase family enzyme